MQQEQVKEKNEPLTINPPRMQIDTPPRVRFDLGANEEQLFDSTTPPQLIVASSAKPRIATSESIADRVKRRRETPPSFGQSIAERVAQWRRESARPVLNQDTGKMLKYRQMLRDPKHEANWSKAGANEFGWLAQGVGGRIDGTNTIFFIHKHEIPQDRLKDVTYIKFVSLIRMEKEDPHQIQATLRGNLIQYPDDVGTPTANLLLIKIFLNSVISTDRAKFATADLSNFYFMTPLKRPENGRVKLMDISDKILGEYKLHEKATPDGWIYFKVVQGMYGLHQSGSNSHDELDRCQNKEGYFKSPLGPALWKHKTRPTQFVLIVDDFGIKYFMTEDLDHLINTLEKYYDIKVNPEGTELVKIELDWDYKNRKVHLSMKPYIDKSLRQSNNVVPTKHQHSLYPHVKPKYGAKQQFVEYDESEPAGDDEKKHIQKANGKFIWYGRGVDGTILTPLSAIAAKQSNPTIHTMQKANSS